MTDKLNLTLRNCYGIKELDAELEFKHKGYAIYAPNGVMKTSLAKTMMDLSKGKKPRDLHFPDRESSAEAILNDQPLKADEIFVVRSYDESYASGQVSTLLANAELKRRFEGVHKSIGEAKKTLDKALRRISGFGERSRENIDSIIEEVFDGEYFDSLDEIESEINDTKGNDLSKVDYTILFDKKVQQLLSDSDVSSAVEDFAKKYGEITEKSPILRKEFQYHNITKVQEQLKENNFFDAGHKIKLSDKHTNEQKEYDSDSSFQELIEEERRRVLEDDGVKEKFDAFNAKITNKELQAFRDYITDHKHLLPKLNDLQSLRRELWVQYLVSARDELSALLSEYRKGREDLSKITEEAEKSRGDWDEVVAEFNRRFLYLPFELFIENKADAILKGVAPSVGFIVRDAGDERRYSTAEKADLVRVLSTGEGRALYILDIMYEVHTRWKERSATLFVFDDISDSFDYKNKFAIVDFLEDITKREDTNFLAIILTHNFDFLRTVSSRKICPAHQCRLATRSDAGVRLTAFNQSDIHSPFHKWQNRLSEPSILTAYIPFLRNVIEYTSGTKNVDGSDNADYLMLTRMLHFKDETESLTIQDYKGVFERHLPNCTFPSIDDEKKVVDYILETADACEIPDDGVNLEHKIVLSMAIRIWAERYMIAKIRVNDPDYDVSKRQTGDLLQSFKEHFNNQIDEIGLLRRVNLITPANIHINAFMYEPILDMGLEELQVLYQDVKRDLV